MNEPVTYDAHDDIKDTCKYAAAFSRYTFQGLERGVLPSPSSATATVSFIEVNSRCYAVTACHVIEAFRRLANADGNEYEGYMCLPSPGVAILGPFLTPPRAVIGSRPDIAICPVDRELCLRIGKEPFRVLSEYDAMWPVPYAVAVGFPTEEKSDRKDTSGLTRMALPCFQAVAASVGSDGSGDQIQFYSELNENLEVENLSGMSGGPVFWSDAEQYGLLGFVKEAFDNSSKDSNGDSRNGSRVHFLCQRVDFSILERWTNYVSNNWQIERNKINAAIRSKEAKQ